ncbi:MAG: GntR family transcriptional regulator [Pseudomonadota bacterium]
MAKKNGVTIKSSPTQAELVRLGLESDIFSGRLAPGVTLNESRIAEAYAVSRTPVREAISALVRAGLVTKQAQKRAVVTPLDVELLLELFEALAEIEAIAARLATDRMTQAQKQALVDLHNRAQAASTEEAHVYAELGRQFHQLVVAGCKNKALIDAAEALAGRVNPFRRFQVLAPERIRTNQDDHERVLNAILRGDARRAGDAMRQHTTDQGDMLVRYIALHKVSYADVAPPRPETPVQAIGESS